MSCPARPSSQPGPVLHRRRAGAPEGSAEGARVLIRNVVHVTAMFALIAYAQIMKEI
jgi:hypothetical protein